MVSLTAAKRVATKECEQRRRQTNVTEHVQYRGAAAGIFFREL